MVGRRPPFVVVLAVVSFFRVARGTTCYDMVMTDSWGDGWSGAEYTINDGSKLTVATGTGPTGLSQTDSVCLADGCYTLEVSNDFFNSEVSWTFGGVMSGSSPYSATGFLADGTIVGGGCDPTDAPTLTQTDAPTPLTPYPSGTARPVWTFSGARTQFGSVDDFVELTVMTRLEFSSEIAISGVNRSLYGDYSSQIRRRLLSGSSTSILDGLDSSRLFSLDSGAVLTLDGLSIVNGYGDTGGCFYVDSGSRLELRDVEASNCVAFLNGGGGGLAYILDGSTIVLDSVSVLESQAPDGFGGVVYALESYITITASNFTNNYAYQCGAFRVEKTKLVVSESTFLNNSVDNSGGVFCAEYASNDWVGSGAVTDAGIFATRCVFESNSAGVHGGVSYSSSSDVYLEHCQVSDSWAWYDGAVAYEYFSESLSFIGGLYSNNRAANDGGLVATASLYVGILTLIDITATENSAIQDGGGVYVDFGSSGGCQIQGGTFSSNAATYGGVIVVMNGLLTLNDATFLDNSATYGGVLHSYLSLVANVNALYAENNATFGAVFSIDEAEHALEFKNCTASKNQALAQGGVIYCAKNLCQVKGMQGTLFTGNSAVEGSAVFIPPVCSAFVSGLNLTENRCKFSGTIYVSLDASATLANLTSTENSAEVGAAFVYCSALSRVVITSVTSENDFARFFGVVAVNNLAALTLQRATFMSADVARGVLYLSGAKTVSVASVTFGSNSARESGAAVYAESFGVLIIIDSTFTDNAATDFGGVFYFDGNGPYDASATVANATIRGNEASQDGGVFVAGEGVQVAFVDCNVTENRAQVNGGVAVVANSAEWTVSRTSFIGNRAVSGDGGLAKLDAATFVSAGSAVIKNNVAANGNGGVFALFGNASIRFASSDVVKRNSAPLGGGGVAYFDHVTTSTPDVSPSILNSNTALYGDMLASNVASIRASHAAPFEASAVEFETPIVVTALDKLDQTVTTSIDENVILSETGKNITIEGGLSLSFDQGQAETVVFVMYSFEDDSTAPIVATLALDYATYVDTLPISLRACVAGEHWNEDRRECEWCASATFSFSPENPCAACDADADCPGGHAMEPAAGFWRSHGESTNVRKCLLSAHCSGGIDIWNASADLVCANHHEGPLCAVCENTFAFNSKRECVKCPTATQQWLALCLVIGVGCIVVGTFYVVYALALKLVPDKVCTCKEYIIVKYKSVKESSLISWTKFKLLIIHWQTLSSQILVFNFISYPSSVSALRFIGFDIASVLAMTFCKSDFLNKLTSITVLPVVVLMCVGVVYMVFRYVKPPATPDGVFQLKAKTLTMVLTIAFVVYTAVSNAIFATFRCDGEFARADGEPNGSKYRDQSYLVADYSVRCGSKRYKVFETYATIMVFVYVMGIPALFLVLLLLNIDTINPSDALLMKEAKNLASGLPAQESAMDASVMNSSYHVRSYTPDEALRRLAKDYVQMVRHVGAAAPAAKQCAMQLRLMLRDMETKIDALKILFYDYKPAYWYFEIIMCLSRLALTCVLPSFIPADNKLGLLYGTTLVAFGFCIMIIMIQPYADAGTNFAACILAALTTLTLTLTVWLFVEDNLVKAVRAKWSTSALGESLLLLNVTLGPLSLVVDIGFEFGIIAFIGAFICSLFSFNALKLRKQIDNCASPRGKYACVAPDFEGEAQSPIKPGSKIVVFHNSPSPAGEGASVHHIAAPQENSTVLVPIETNKPVVIDDSPTPTSSSDVETKPTTNGIEMRQLPPLKTKLSSNRDPDAVRSFSGALPTAADPPTRVIDLPSAAPTANDLPGAAAAGDSDDLPADNPPPQPDDASVADDDLTFVKS